MKVLEDAIVSLSKSQFKQYEYISVLFGRSTVTGKCAALTDIQRMIMEPQKIIAEKAGCSWRCIESYSWKVFIKDCPVQWIKGLWGAFQGVD